MLQCHVGVDWSPLEPKLGSLVPTACVLIGVTHPWGGVWCPLFLRMGCSVIPDGVSVVVPTGYHRSTRHYGCGVYALSVPLVTLLLSWESVFPSDAWLLIRVMCIPVKFPIFLWPPPYARWSIYQGIAGTSLVCR